MIQHDPNPMIRFLNHLLEVDRDAVENLVAARVPCGQRMAEHQSVQVGGEEGRPTVGLLGLLNGFFGTFDGGPKAGWGPITAVVDDDDHTRIREFILTPNKDQPNGARGGG